MDERVPLTGEPLALDLVNTRPTVGDLLQTSNDLLAWWNLESARLPEMPEAVTDADVAVVRALREHISNALEYARRGDQPLASDLDAINQAQRFAPAIRELTWNGSALIASCRRSGPAGRCLAARLAEAAAELLADPSIMKIRECEADDCVMLFLPSHPRRRWCSAARCGNRARVARHYQRHKVS